MIGARAGEDRCVEQPGPDRCRRWRSIRKGCSGLDSAASGKEGGVCSGKIYRFLFERRKKKYEEIVLDFVDPIFCDIINLIDDNPLSGKMLEFEFSDKAASEIVTGVFVGAGSLDYKFMR